jgi:hypothetical protein
MDIFWGDGDAGYRRNRFQGSIAGISDKSFSI